MHLVAHLRARGYRLLDTQMWSPHLAQFGCVEVEREDFLRALTAAVGERSVSWGLFAPSARDAVPSRAALPEPARGDDAA